MNTETRRNDPCPCGSGKKYKKCCLQNNSSNLASIDFAWHTLRQIEGRVIDNHLMPYITKKIPQEMMTQAIEDFRLADVPEEIDKESLFTKFFIPWFMFNWIAAYDFEIEAFNPEETIAMNYLNTHSHQLNHREKRFIEAMNQTYYSFYTILEVEPEKSLLIKDILLGTLHTIKERQGTQFLKRGDIVFSRIITLDNQSIFVGMAPYIIPARYQNTLLDYRDWLIEENQGYELNATLLQDEFDLELLDYFFDLLEEACNRPDPILTNTDGELIQLTKTYFKLSLSPEEVLKRLLPMTLSKDPEEFLYDADRHKSGHITRIEFSWLKKGNKKHKDWENTVMGHIVIEKDQLTLETNSEKRAQKGQNLLNKYLGEMIHFQQKLIESLDQKRQSLPESSHENKAISDDWLKFSPEVQAQIKQMAEAHWTSWCDQSIPVLNHQTPREAAKTKEGRERLEALLLQYERYDLEKEDDDPFKADIHYLRTELALDEI